MDEVVRLDGGEDALRIDAGEELLVLVVGHKEAICEVPRVHIHAPVAFEWYEFEMLDGATLDVSDEQVLDVSQSIAVCFEGGTVEAGYLDLLLQVSNVANRCLLSVDW